MLILQTPIIEKKVSSFRKQSVQRGMPFTFKANKGLALRIYPDNRPQNLEIAALQKGLVLVVDGSELIEEGAGFGLPIARYSERTFFSRAATVHVEEQGENSAVIAKIFSLDSVSKKRVHGAFINDGIYSVFHKTFEKAYLRRGNMRSFFDLVMRLRRTMGVETYFACVSPKGKVTVRYHCFPDHIKVCADFSEVDMTSCKEILILNEQGATFFRKHRNGNVVLHDKKIGAWARVNTEHAEFSDLEDRISFSMEKKDSAILYCGWEQVKDRFSWAGMTYALSPKTLIFNYTIRLRENTT
jgi:hypothetical protein